MRSATHKSLVFWGTNAPADLVHERQRVRDREEASQTDLRKLHIYDNIMNSHKCRWGFLSSPKVCQGVSKELQKGRLGHTAGGIADFHRLSKCQATESAAHSCAGCVTSATIFCVPRSVLRHATPGSVPSELWVPVFAEMTLSPHMSHLTGQSP